MNSPAMTSVSASQSRRLPIHLQMLLLVLVAMLPVFGLFAWYLGVQSKQAHDDAYARVKLIADTTAANLALILHDNQDVLSRFAARPLVRALDPGRCDPLLQQYVQLHPEFTTLVSRNLEAGGICSSLPNVPDGEQARGFPHFQEGLRSGKFTVGDAFLGPASGRWLSVLTYPLQDAQGRQAGLLALPLDLLALNQRVLGAVPGNTRVQVLDRQNKFLLRSVDPARWIGQAIPAAASDMGRDQSAGFVTTRGVDGIVRMFAFVTVSGTGWRVAASVPEEDVLAGYRALRNESLALGAVALLLVLALAWRIGSTIVNPVRALAGTAASVAAGDAAARAEADGPIEIEAVAREFNRMLDVRMEFEQQLQAERNLSAAMIDGAGALLVVLDREGRIRRFNRAAEQLSGYRLAEIEGRYPWDTLLPPEDADTIRKGAFEALAADPAKMSGRYTNHWLTRSGDRRLIDWVNTVLLDGRGRMEFMVSVGIDITERRQMEERLQLSESRLQQAQGIARIGNWEFDPRNGHLWWSAEVFRLFEIDPACFGASYEAFLNGIHPDDRERVTAAYTQSLRDRTPYRITHRLLMADGRVKFVEERCETEFAADGTPLRSRGTVQDVTERTLNEQVLHRTLQENETLLREVHHRVKNNLQIVSSLLHFQAKKLQQPEARLVFGEARQRLRSMMLLHEKLYNGTNLAEVDFADYIRSLVNELRKSSGGAGQRIDFRVETSPLLLLPVASALPAGMILVELLTNVMKYAFPAGSRGAAVVGVVLADGEVSLGVSDNGVGLPEGFDLDDVSSFGWQLIRSLSTQLDGTVTIRREAGTQVTVCFPLEPAP